MENRTGKVWTREEIIIALCLYYKLTSLTYSGTRDHAIDEIAALLGRNHGSVEFKLANIISCDTSTKATGFKNINKLDKEVFDEYFLHTDKLFKDGSEILKEKYTIRDEKNVLTENNPFMNTRYENVGKIFESNQDFSGLDITREVKTRNKQWAFRTALLSTYEHTCCISGISQPELLVASHIVPWADNKEKRLDPANGLLLNSLLDRAFDQGLITFHPGNHSLIISEKIKDINLNFQKFDTKIS